MFYVDVVDELRTTI